MRKRMFRSSLINAAIVFGSTTFAFGAVLDYPTGMPVAGVSGKASGRVSLAGSLGTAVKPAGFANVIAEYRPHGEAVRGGAEAAIYSKISPSVVLVFTDKGLGSGSLISADGQILTNYHVVDGFTQVGVLFKPTKEGEKPDPANAILADVIKVDPKTDLALLKLRKAPSGVIQPIAFGDFGKVKVGDDVNAIGHPEGESWTFTRGYVSQIRLKYDWKNEDGKDHEADVIQTQTPINPGNSGGPLLSGAGQLIGVNAFKDTGAEGLNFAVGVDTVQGFLKSKGMTVAEAKSADKCKPKTLFDGRTKDNDGALTQIDVLCHGKINLAVVLPDDKSKPMVAVVDMDETGKPQGMVLSNNRDGHWDVSYWDTKGSGRFDMMGHHPDGSIIPSSYEPYKE